VVLRRILYVLRTLWEDMAGAARLAADARSFVRLTTDFLLYRPMKLFRPPGLNRERRIRVRGGVEIIYRLNRGDIWALHEVWIREIYRMPLAQKPRVIVDLGANIGLTALWLATHYGCNQLIAVEPVRANAELARRNLEQNGICSEVIEAAVGAEDGTATLLETLSSTNSTVTFTQGKGKREKGKVENSEEPNTEIENRKSKIENRKSDTPYLNTRTPEHLNTVPVVSMSTVLKSLPHNTTIDLLKMDIEGSEGEVLSGEVGWLHRVNSLIAEFHPAHADPAVLTAILEQSGLKQTPRDLAEENIEFFTRLV
jgi:FkbM family methyltransferase